MKNAESLRPCHCEAPKGPWRPEREARGSALGVQSREGSCVFADGFPVIWSGTARLPRRFAPRNDTSGSAVVHQRPPTVELPCTGRSLRSRWRLCRLTDAASPLRGVSAMEACRLLGIFVERAGVQVCHSEERSDVGISCSSLRIRRSLPVIQPDTARLHPKGTSSRFALRAPRRPSASSQ